MLTAECCRERPGVSAPALERCSPLWGPHPNSGSHLASSSPERGARAVFLKSTLQWPMGQAMGSILPRMTLRGCQAAPIMPAPGFPTSPAIWGPGSRPSPRLPHPPSRAVLLLLCPARVHTRSVSLCPLSPAGVLLLSLQSQAAAPHGAGPQLLVGWSASCSLTPLEL